MIGTREWTQHILIKALCSPSRDEVNREIISDVKPEYFTSNTYRKSIRLIREHYEETGEFYTWSEFLKTEKLGESVAKKIRALEQRRKTLAKKDDSLLLPKKDKESYTTFIKRIQHDARHIKLIELQNTLSDKLETDMDESSLEPLLNLVRDTVDELDNLKINKGILFKVNKGTIREKLKGFYRNLKENFFIPTGFHEFDDINIGIPLSSLFVMAAPTGCGKSSLCLQYLMNAVKAGANVCLLPLEMSEEEMLLKMASNLLEIPTNELVRDLKRYYKKIVKSLVKFLAESDGCFHFYTPDIDETLPMVLMKLKNNHYDIIAVDYINLLAGMDKEKWLALDAAGIYAKRFAGKYKTQIVFLAQLDKNTGDTRYSKALMEHACIAGDSLISTPTGFIQMSDIVKSDKKGFHKMDNPVEIITDSIKRTTIDTYYVNGVDDVYSVILDDGREIKCTENHKFLILTKDWRFRWRKLKYLHKGDNIIQSGYEKFARSKVFNKIYGRYIEKKVISREKLFSIRKEVEVFPDKVVRKIRDYNLNFRQIRSVTYIGKEMTYDLYVPETHNYVLNGIMSHNSNMFTWNHTAQDIIENQRIEILQPKARGQNPKPFPLRANLACSKFTDYIEDMDDNYNKQKSYKKKGQQALSKGFDSSGSDLPPDD